MIRSVETTGRTQDDAIAAGLRELGVTRDEVTVEILERAKSGFFGFGATPAKVRVTLIQPEPEPEPAPAPAPAPKAAPKAAAPRASQQPAPAPAPKPAPKSPAQSGDETEKVDAFLRGLLERMGVEANVETTFDAGTNTVSVELSGEKVGALIGRRGETLDAIQHLTNYVVNSGSEDRTRVNIDAENYRAKRADALTGLARKTAAKVVRYRRNQTLEPMNAYERHVIHTALQDFDGVTTFSTGTEPNRRVVIAYDAGTAPKDPPYESRGDRGGRGDRSRGGRDQRRSSGYTRPAPAPAPEKPPVDKTVREWN